MPVFWLDEQSLEFPAPELATPEGILAVGGDLSPARLLEAYAGGIFPWFNEGDPILWWSPDPRFVLIPDELVVSKSMRPYFNQKKFQVSFDQDFEGVMRSCQQSNRNGQSGDTWITEDMIQAYVQVHQLGYAHSVEVWQEGDLVGGLYGISLGKIFFGESMFARVSNASKFGFITLVQKLRERGFTLIDCQQQTQHLGSLGAKPISRKSFLKYLQENKKLETLTGSWAQILAE
jgi:leucyl/phenylalanyl-tRNA---protein transferase